MVITCAYPDCSNRFKAKRLRSLARTHPGLLTFHRFPTSEPDRLKLWLLALRLDINTPINLVKLWRVCSDHFSPDDFKDARGDHVRLISSAVPLVFSHRTEDSQQELYQPIEHESDEGQETECLGAEIGLKYVPQSTPLKAMKTGVEEKNGLQDKSHKHMMLLLTSPQSSEKQSYPSTSGTYYAVPPVRSQQLDKHADSECESDDLNISMLSLDPPSEKKDVSFVPPSSTSPSSTTTTTEEEEELPSKERKWIVNESALMNQFRRCQDCGALITEKTITTSGSLISVLWECEQGHNGQWKSCSDVRGIPSNNLLVSAGTLLTGSTYAGISEWAAVLNLQVPHKTTFYAIQSSYLIPAIDEAFKEQQTALLEDLKAENREKKEIHLSGDGRSDSPGYSAKYTTYSLMDDKTDKVVHFELVQVTESSSSVAMESTGFRRALNKFLHDDIEINVVTTDRSPSIRKTMRVEYPNIHHEFDVWHVAKGMLKKLASVSRYKDNRALQPWIRSISNHMWFSCSSCGGDPDELIKRWKSLLHHICGVHSWTEDGEERRCLHSELSSDEQRKKKWLDKNTRAFFTLENLVLDKGLLKDLRQMALFKHTGRLEVFHSLLLKYCPKRIHFHYTSMLARTQVAVLDHNENVNRQQAITSTGTPRFNVVFPKHSKQWVARKLYESTTQNFRDNLICRIFQRRMDSSITYKDSSSHLATQPVPKNISQQTKPSKEDTVSKHFSRFSK